VRATERAASDGEFWVFFFVPYFFFFFFFFFFSETFFFLFVEARCFGGGRGGVTSTHSLTLFWVVMLFLCFVLCFFPSPRPSIHLCCQRRQEKEKESVVVASQWLSEVLAFHGTEEALSLSLSRHLSRARMFVCAVFDTFVLSFSSGMRENWSEKDSRVAVGY
jgi:hypothetical protein